MNTACGLDGVSAEHLKNCGRQIIPLLAMCLTGFMVHGFLPKEMMSVCLIPVIKDKRAKISNKDNYRPVALYQRYLKWFYLIDYRSTSILIVINLVSSRNLGLICVYIIIIIIIII